VMWTLNWNDGFPLRSMMPVVVNRHIWYEHATMVATAGCSGWHDGEKWHKGHAQGGGNRWWTNPDTGEIRYGWEGPPSGDIKKHHAMTEEDLKRTRWETE
jgi:hypothetical protein